MKEQKEDEKLIKETAIKLLAMREHAAFELTNKLTKKGFDEHLVVNVIERLRRQGIQSDERFTEAFIRHKVSKGFGPIRIRYELNEMNISNSLINQYMTTDPEYWSFRAEKVRVKKFGFRKAHTFPEEMKQKKFLYYRGFTDQHINPLF